MKRALLILTATALSVATAATNLVSNTATVTNRCAAIVTYTMSNGVARVQDPSGKLIGTAEERALKVAAEGQADIASAAADAAGTAMEEWREFTATTDVKVCYIDAGFSQDLPALATNLCGWVAGSFYDHENGEDHYYVWFNREMDAPPAMCARIVSERGTNWLDGTWKDWAVTNWIDKATGREFVMPTARDYVQDGLIAMWDGEWNVAPGVHDGNSLEWVDIIGGRKLHPYYATASSVTPTWGENHMICNGNLSEWRGDGFDDLYQTIETNCTAEFAYDHSSIASDGGQGISLFATTPSRVLVFEPANNALAQGMVCSYRFYAWGSGVSQPGVYLPQNRMTQEVYGLHTATVIGRGAGNDFSAYVDANHVVTKACDSRYYRTWNGVRIRSYSSTVGKYFCFRVYNRQLTTAEIAANYSVDAQRFGLEPLDHFAVPCRELVIPRRNVNCVLKTGTVITLGGRDGFDADIHKINIEVGGTPTPTTSAQLPLFHTVTYSGTNRVVRAYTNGFVNVENGFVKEPTNE